MRTTLILALAVCLASCTANQKKIFSTENLPAQKFTIDISRDTTIQTANGAWLDIPAGSITANTGNVTLEIKEAYSLADMVKAGLITRSNGQPLSSGGMIYINAGDNAKIVKPIRMATPSGWLDKDMQLYKGTEGESGEINWTDPQSLDSNEKTMAVENGRQLFQGTCGSCHQLGKVLTGPDLAHFDKRFGGDGHGVERFRKFSHEIFFNYREGSDSTDLSLTTIKDRLYACNLREQFGSLGQQFPDLTREQWASIYAYVQSESNRLDLPLPAQTALYDCLDSCETYSQLTKDLLRRRDEAVSGRNKKIEDNGDMTEFNDKFQKGNIRFGDTLDTLQKPDIERVVPRIYASQYYHFKIESFGWYNIDALVKDEDGVIESELFVTVSGKYTDRVNLFLLIPSRKINVEGGPSANGKNEYAFYEKNGKIPLPAGETCYIVAVSEVNDEMAYAVKSFTAAASQRFDIQLEKTSKKEFNKAMDIFNDKSMKIKVQKAKNANEIRKIDKSLQKIDDKLKAAEKFKPKNCDCNCGARPADTTTDAIEYIAPK
jgi:hypothetical protein